MRATTNLVRVAFMVLAMVTYARPSSAGSPSWYANCDSGCTGSARYHQCTFIDYADIWDTEPGCTDTWWTDPYHSSCCGDGPDYEHEAYTHWYEECRLWAGGGPPTFTGFSCSDNYTAGSFYCSYSDESCAG